MNKKGLSPLVATVLLVAFALVIGTIAMSWGKNYIAGIAHESEEVVSDNVVTINLDDIDSPLKKLQLEYIQGKISEEEYRQKEEGLTK